MTEVDTYETVITGEDDIELVKLLEEKRIHAVTFTSSSTVRNFLGILKRMGLEDPLALLAGVKIACIGPVTEQTAVEAGLTPGLLPEEATIEGLVQELCRWNESTRLR